nr:NADH dehydrogenase subunit 2 [Ixodes granulatus]
MFFQKMIFSWILITTIFMGISSSCWFILWMTLEINLMVYIPLMNSKNFLSSNSMLIYFIIQSFSSSLFFFSSLLETVYKTNMLIFLILMSMMIKLGAPPFHMWFPQISEGLNLYPFFILLTLQKMIPLFIISIFNNIFIIPFIIISSITGSIGGFNQISMKKILAFSSISHLAWMMSLIICNQFFWMMYLLIYSMILLKISMNFKKNYIVSINNLNLMKLNFFNKVSMITLFLSLGGLPPFLGFFMKWMTVILILKNFPLILLILIPSSLINLFFYTRVVFPTLLKFNILMKPFQIYSNFKKNWMIFMNFLSIIILTPLIMIM